MVELIQVRCGKDQLVNRFFLDFEEMISLS